MPSITKPLHFRRFEAVLFDLGSTLIYFDGAHEQAYAKSNEALWEALKSAGLELNREQFLEDFTSRMRQYFAEREMEFIEYTTAYILRTLLGEYGFHDLPDSLIQPALNARYAVSQAYWKREIDTLPTLEELRCRGYRMGMISNAGDDTDVQTLIDLAEIRPYFEAIITSASLGIRKPNPLIFKIMLDKMGLPAEKAVMVGDTLGADILGARNAGIFSVWITRRADTAANRSHVDTIAPDLKISTLAELLDLLE